MHNNCFVPPLAWSSVHLHTTCTCTCTVRNYNTLASVFMYTYTYIYIHGYISSQILVHGPDSGMIIGTAEFPFQNRVTLTLTGNRGDRSLRLGGGLQLGTKSIGVFGNVSIAFLVF